MRCATIALDARRGAQPMANHWQAPQRGRRAIVTQPGGTGMVCAHSGVARHLFGMTKPRGSRLALRANHARRTLVSCRHRLTR